MTKALDVDSILFNPNDECDPLSGCDRVSIVKLYLVVPKTCLQHVKQSLNVIGIDFLAVFVISEIICNIAKLNIYGLCHYI